MQRILIFCLVTLACSGALHAKSIAYIYGDVAPDGSVPSGENEPFHQMLLTDSGKLGLSTFHAMVEGEGYQIGQFYDQETNLSKDFLKNFDVIIFGLHQKEWSDQELSELDAWIHAGGGILTYSDSASGGHYKQVGLRNSVGQQTVNRIISKYGMEVATDQGGGTRAYQPDEEMEHPIVKGLILEGEGVSPVAVPLDSNVKILIPCSPQNYVDGKSKNLKIQDDGISLQDYQWAALAMAPVGQGHVIALFDRQPLWNNGPGSSIQRKDNQEILRRIIHFLAGSDPDAPSR